MSGGDWILFLGTYPPRECGIATFTQDISRSVEARFNGSVKSKIVALNKNGTSLYNYPEEVIFEIKDNDISDYIRAAKKINRMNSVKVVSIQHEFGIFGGEYGSYLISLLEVLKKPVVITFHSVLPKPDNVLKSVVRSLAEKSASFIVMNKLGVDILRKDYGVRNDIRVVPHGIPDVELVSPLAEKKKLGFEDNIVLSSFGMISSGKGYEYVIDSLPEVVKLFPNIVYLIMGETHPVVRKEEGEKYRNFLEKKVKKLGLQNNVKFYNKYLKLSEIISYLKATDVYISSSLNPNQITSGTLVYSLGTGRPVISTPFLHAKEILNDSIGRFASFKSSRAYSKAIIELLSNDNLRKEMGKVAYAETRKMTWNNVAKSYMDIFNEKVPITEKYSKVLPKIKLGHLLKLTDSFGIIQFSKNTKPDINSGYTLDDNARALSFCCDYLAVKKDEKVFGLLKTYFNFIKHVQSEDGSFSNLVDKERAVDADSWSSDAFGRAIWSLGILFSSKVVPDELRIESSRIIEKALPVIKRIESPRSIAFVLLGLYEYNKSLKSQEITDKISELAGILVKEYKTNSSPGWDWFQSYLAYSNGRQSEALFKAYQETKNPDYLDVAVATTDFLVSTTFQNRMFCPVGHDGWYYKSGKRAHFDQQPVDACSMIDLLVNAFEVTKKEKYFENAYAAFDWFLGNNETGCAVYDELTGGCHDGLGSTTINLNEGAESTISYLSARLKIESAKGLARKREAVAEKTAVLKKEAVEEKAKSI